jgi:hypothetical protein
MSSWNLHTQVVILFVTNHVTKLYEGRLMVLQEISCLNVYWLLKGYTPKGLLIEMFKYRKHIFAITMQVSRRCM